MELAPSIRKKPVSDHSNAQIAANALSFFGREVDHKVSYRGHYDKSIMQEQLHGFYLVDDISIPFCYSEFSPFKDSYDINLTIKVERSHKRNHYFLNENDEEHFDRTSIDRYLAIVASKLVTSLSQYINPLLSEMVYSSNQSMKQFFLYIYFYEKRPHITCHVGHFHPVTGSLKNSPLLCYYGLDNRHHLEISDYHQYRPLENNEGPSESIIHDMVRQVLCERTGLERDEFDLFFGSEKIDFDNFFDTESKLNILKEISEC